MTFPKPHRTTLSNGLRVVVVPMRNNPTVTVQVLVEAGSGYEEKKINGISHFLEHMCFKGTKNRPTAHDIAHEFEEIGARNNAFTGEEYTGYWAKARIKHFEHIFDMVSDIYLNPLLPEVEMEKERGVIIQEINMYDDDPQSVVGDALDGLMYGEQPAGRSILGTKENIRTLTREDLVLYREQHYIPQKTLIVVAGDVKPAHVLRLVKKSFGHLPKGKVVHKIPVKERQSKPMIKIVSRKTKQTHFLLAFRGLSAQDPHFAVSRILGRVLGSGMSSRLFQKLRDEMGVCYYVNSGSFGRSDYGAFIIRAGVDTNRLEEVVQVIFKELQKLKDELIPQKELNKVKEMVVSSIEMGLESSDEMADWYGGSELLRYKRETPEQRQKVMRAVTSKQLQAIARRLLKNSSLNFAVIGPVKNTVQLKKLLKI